MDLPDSLEAYFQEAGRAGRDGQKAYAVLLYTPTDKTTLRRRIATTYPDKNYIRELYDNMNYYFQMAMGDGQNCLLPFALDDFCRRFHYFPVPADSALKILTQAGYIEYIEAQDNTSRLMFLVQRDELYTLRRQNETQEIFVRTVLRLYSGVFAEYAHISEENIALHSGYSADQVYEGLLTLARQGVIDYIPRRKTPYILYTRPRTDGARIVLAPDIYEQRRAHYERRIESVLHYAESQDECRSRLLLRYFGETEAAPCGSCDVCV
jgi:ATP-dependent DNA helicase RecQ